MVPLCSVREDPGNYTIEPTAISGSSTSFRHDPTQANRVYLPHRSKEATLTLIEEVIQLANTIIDNNLLLVAENSTVILTGQSTGSQYYSRSGGC